MPTFSTNYPISSKAIDLQEKHQTIPQKLQSCFGNVISEFVGYEDTTPNNQQSTAIKIAKSIGNGLKNSMMLSGTSIMGLIAAQEMGIYKFDPILVTLGLLPVIGGTALAAHKFYALSQDNTASPSTQKSLLAKVAMCLKSGWTGFTAPLPLFLLFSPRSSREFVFGTSALVGAAGIARTFTYLLKKPSPISSELNTVSSTTVKTESVASTNIKNVVDFFGAAAKEVLGVENDTSSQSSLAIKVARSVGHGTLMGLSTFGTIGTILIAAKAHNIRLINPNDQDLWLVGIPAISGLTLAAAKLYRQTTATSSTALSPAPMSTLAKIQKCLHSGFIGFTASILPTFAALSLAEIVEPNLLLGTSALIGAAAATKRCIQSSQKLEKIVKDNKKSIAIASALALMTLGILYAGPSTIIDSIQRNTVETALSFKRKHDSLAYTVESTIVDKTKRELIDDYTDLEDLKRIANYSQDVSCAEILNTCNLEPKDKEHRQRLLSKMKIWHPDKVGTDSDLEMVNMTGKVTRMLNELFPKLKKEGCLGQDEIGCWKSEEIVERTRVTLTKPNWIYAKFLNIQPECEFNINGNIRFVEPHLCDNALQNK